MARDIFTGKVPLDNVIPAPPADWESLAKERAPGREDLIDMLNFVLPARAGIGLGVTDAIAYCRDVLFKAAPSRIWVPYEESEKEQSRQRMKEGRDPSLRSSKVGEIVKNNFGEAWDQVTNTLQHLVRHGA